MSEESKKRFGVLKVITGAECEGSDYLTDLSILTWEELVPLLYAGDVEPARKLRVGQHGYGVIEWFTPDFDFLVRLEDAE